MASETKTAHYSLAIRIGLADAIIRWPDAKQLPLG